MKNAVNLCLLAILIFIISVFVSRSQDTTATPRLIIPKDSTWNISPYTTFCWFKVNNAEVYRIQYSKNHDMSDSKFIVTNDTSYYFEEPLDLFTWYYWKVQAGKYINANKDILWFNLGSKTWKFRTLQVLLWPPYIHFIESPNRIPTFKWNKVAAAEFYRFQLTYDRNFDSLVIDSITSDTILKDIKLEYAKHCKCRVNAINDDYISNWSESQGFVTGTQFSSSIPQNLLISPKCDTIKQPLNGTLIWKAYKEDGYTFTYRVQLIEGDYYPQLILIDTITSDTIYKYYDLKYFTNYTWKLRIMSEVDTSYTNSYCTFRTKFETMPELPNKVELFEPQDKDTMDIYVYDMYIVGFLLKWYPSYSFIDNYWVEVSTDANFSQSYYDSTVKNTEFDKWYYAKENVMNYWRIRAYNDSGWGPYSDVWSFYAFFHPEGIEDSPSADNYIVVFPNPISDFAYIKIKSKEQGKGVIKIFNILGIEVDYIEYENSESGEITINWKTQSLPIGTYFMKTRIGGREIVKPIQKF